MKLLERFCAHPQCGFIPFIVAGDPDLQTSAKLISALSELNPIAIEVGVPFSDPTADGAVIQRSSQRALQNNVNLSGILTMLKKNRSRNRAPIVLFGYYNPILQFGIERFAQSANTSDLSGVLVVDLPAEAAEHLRIALRRYEIDLIFLIAPTTNDQRLRHIAQRASGFIYAVARTGVTGRTRGLADESKRLVRRIQAVSNLPIAVGFGIDSRAQAHRVCRYADAVVVGSHIVAAIETATTRRSSSRENIVSEVIRCARQFA